MSLDKITDSISQQCFLTSSIKTPQRTTMSPRELVDHLESESYCIEYPDTKTKLTKLISRDLSALILESIA